MTEAEARAFQTRWKLVNEREDEELRITPVHVKLQQFNMLLSWARCFGWTRESFRRRK